MYSIAVQGELCSGNISTCVYTNSDAGFEEIAFVPAEKRFRPALTSDVLIVGCI